MESDPKYVVLNEPARAHVPQDESLRETVRRVVVGLAQTKRKKKSNLRYFL